MLEFRLLPMGDHIDFPQAKSSCDVSFESATCLAMCKLVKKKWGKKRLEEGSGVVSVAAGLPLAL